jgi:magnesium chelatase family protein
LESLRQSIETGRAVVSRANHHVTYPSRFQLIAAMNPCRCGYLGDPSRACTKAPRCGADYQGKISGPIFDRIDLHVEVPAVMAEDLAKPAGENYAEIPDDLRPLCNAQLDGEMLAAYATPDADGQKLLSQAADKFKISARGYMRLLRVARTLADLAAEANVRRAHIAEALAYRRLNLDSA